MPPHMRARGAALTPQVAGETKESLLQQEKEEEERLRQERREKTAAKRRAAKQAAKETCGAGRGAAPGGGAFARPKGGPERRSPPPTCPSSDSESGGGDLTRDGGRGDGWEGWALEGTLLPGASRPWPAPGIGFEFRHECEEDERCQDVASMYGIDVASLVLKNKLLKRINGWKHLTASVRLKAGTVCLLCTCACVRPCVRAPAHVSLVCMHAGGRVFMQRRTCKHGEVR